LLSATDLSDEAGNAVLALHALPNGLARDHAQGERGAPSLPGATKSSWLVMRWMPKPPCTEITTAHVDLRWLTTTA
jgi:hypothetical protein